MPSHEIPLVNLETQIHDNKQTISRLIFENEINGIRVEHVTQTAHNPIIDTSTNESKTIYLFVNGRGIANVANKDYEIVPETIFLPNTVDNVTINSAEGETLHYLKISCELSSQDQIDLKALPIENTQTAYYAKFSDCQPYTEAIKSPNTVSRTILSNEYIPRVAMGTVQTKGPDTVAAHEHPMLEQLFLGLSENNCIVYADDEQVEFPAYSVLHIPLGSSHSVSVENDKVMYYVWMDFFLDKKGEDWLKTHNVDTEHSL